MTTIGTSGSAQSNDDCQPATIADTSLRALIIETMNSAYEPNPPEFSATLDPMSRHDGHQYYFGCLVCQGNVEKLADRIHTAVLSANESQASTLAATVDRMRTERAQFRERESRAYKDHLAALRTALGTPDDKAGLPELVARVHQQHIDLETLRTPDAASWLARINQAAKAEAAARSELDTAQQKANRATSHSIDLAGQLNATRTELDALKTATVHAVHRALSCCDPYTGECDDKTATQLMQQEGIELHTETNGGPVAVAS